MPAPSQTVQYSASRRGLAAAVSALVVGLAMAWPGTAAQKADSDGDGVTNAKERARGCSTLRRDTDRDRMPDRFEVRYRLKCDDRRDAHDDPDRDGLSNLREFRRGKNPRRSNVPGLGAEPTPTLDPIVQTGFALVDGFSTGTPDRGGRSYGGGGQVLVTPGAFGYSSAGKRDIAVVAPDFIRLWSEQPEGSCFLDRNGARSYFAAKGADFGLRQPCRGGDPSPDTRWQALNRDGLFTAPSAIATTDVPGQTQGLVIGDVGTTRVNDPRVTAENHGNGRFAGAVHVASDLNGSPRIERIDQGQISEPRSVAAAPGGAKVAALSTECGALADQPCHNQHFPDDVFTVARSGSGWGAPVNLGWADKVATPAENPTSGWNKDSGRQSIVCGGEVLLTDVDGVAPLDVVRWGSLCPYPWRRENSGAIGSAVEFMLNDGGKVVALSTPKTLSGVAFADLDGDGNRDLVLVAETGGAGEYVVGMWNVDPSQQTTTAWGGSRGRDTAPTTTVPGLRYSFKGESALPATWATTENPPGRGVTVADVAGRDVGDDVDGKPDLILDSGVVLSNRGGVDPVFRRVGPPRGAGLPLVQRWDEPVNGERMSRTPSGSLGRASFFAGPDAGQISAFSRGSNAALDRVDVFRATKRGTASLRTTTNRAEAGEPVGFVATLDTQRIVQAEWDFGDGEVLLQRPDGKGAFEVQTSHTFAQAGAPTPTVTLSNEGGNRSTVTLTEGALTVNAALSARLDGPASVRPGQAATLTASYQGGYFPQGTTASYAWELDGAPWPGNPTGATVSTAGLAVGRHAVSVKVRDARRTSPASVPLSIRVAADVTAGIVAGANAMAGAPIELDGSVSTGGIGPLSYAWDLDADGDLDTAPSLSPKVTTTFAACCAGRVRLEVTDNEGVVSATRAERLVTVRTPLAPVIDVAAVSSGFPKTLRLTAARTLGGEKPYRAYAWRADGAPQQEDGPTLELTVAAPGPGPLTVDVTVTDAYGRTATETRRLDVDADLRSDLRFTSAPAHPQAGERVTLTAPASDGTYAWDLGADGTFTPGSRTRTVTYDEPGLKEVRLRVTEAGVVSESRQLVDILPRLTARPTHTPPIPAPGEPVTIVAGATGGYDPSTFRYAWDDDGDGTFPGAAGTDATRELRLARGDRRVGVRVEDAAGHVDTAREAITVADPLVAGLAIAPAFPEAGDAVTFDASSTRGGVGELRYAFDLDGQPGYEVPDSRKDSYATSFDVAIDEPVGVQVTDESGQERTFRRHLEVVARLKPVLADPAPVLDQVITRLDARGTTGGTPPYSFRWDVDGKPGYEQQTGEGARLPVTFDNPGRVSIGVEVTDSLGRVRTDRRDIDVLSGCLSAVTAGLGRITAGEGVCIRDASTGDQIRYVAKGDVRLNGLVVDVPETGGAVTIVPDDGGGAGRITAASAVVKVDGQTVIDGPIDWELPADDVSAPVEEQTVEGVGLPERSVELLGLKLQGRIGWTIGVDAAGEPYTRFRGSLVIPGFHAGEDPATGDPTGVGARVSLRVDAQGTDTDSVFLRVASAKLGKLEVNDLCLSYLAAGNTSGAQCEQFQDFTGKPFLDCRSDVTTNRWDGTADIALPSTGTGLKVSGGLADGKLSHLAAEADLGRRVALEPGVAWLKSIAAGFCLRPAPLKIKGAARITAVPTEKPGKAPEEAIQVDGSFLYTDSSSDGTGQSHPWSIEMTGTVDLYGRRAADARFGFDGDATASFGFHARYQFPNDNLNLASVDGTIDGWVNFNTGRFNVEGSIEQCLASVICSGGEALISSDGVAGCVIIIPEVSFGLLGSTPAVRAGFGFAWSGSFSLMGPSCDIGPWRASPGNRAVGGAYGFDVPKGELVRNLRLGGAGGPPKVVVRGPNGERLEIGEMQRATGAYGEHLMVENSADGTTVVQLVRPTPGRWTVEPKGLDAITKVESSGVEPRPVVNGRVTATADGKRTLHYSYSDEPGVEIAFGEVGAGNDVAAPIGNARRAGETECGKDRKCGTLTFAPAYGDAGKRRIVAAITRGGMPVDNPTVATYTAPVPSRPGAVRRVRISRGANGITAVWDRAPRAERYEVTATELVRRGGRFETGFSAVDPDSTRCYEHAAPDVPGTSRLRVLITAIDSHGERGPTVVRVLPRGVARVGPRGIPGGRLGSDRGERLSGGPRGDVILGLGGRDLLLGGRGGDCLIAGDGDDQVTAGPGDDRVEGDAGDDVVLAGSGDDRLTGARGADVLRGGFGDDTLISGAGNDSLSGGAGTNRYSAGPGNDRVRAANGIPEVVNCGSGRDRVVADRRDTLSGCELVQRVG